MTQYFSWLCAWGGCTMICCRFILYPGKHGFCFCYNCAVLMVCEKNYRIHYGPMVVYICFHFTLSSVCVRLSQFSQLSQLSFMQYMAMCVFSLAIYLMMIVRIWALYLIIITISEVWPMCGCLWPGHEIMVCAICLSIFFKGIGYVYFVGWTNERTVHVSARAIMNYMNVLAMGLFPHIDDTQQTLLLGHLRCWRIGMDNWLHATF